MRRFLLIGNPANRRVGLFTEALREAGQPEPLVLAWLDLLKADFEPLRAVKEPELFVRVDSFGEDFEVEKRLLALGGLDGAAELPERKGQQLEPAMSNRGFQRCLGVLAEVFAARPGWKVLNVPAEIDELFDKRRTSRRFHAASIPVPDFLEEAPADAEALFEEMRRRHWPRTFVKPAMGSSASGVLLVSILPKTGPTITTSLEWDAPHWFNNLKLSHYRTPQSVERALRFVLAQGAVVERAIPKATLNDAFFDLRVVCIAGEPRFVVVRQNKHEITNLHLGGWRGDLSALEATVPAPRWAAMLESCRKVAALYRSLHVGLDVMFEPGFEQHRVIEANAFGDLFPNLTRDGKSVYRWEIDAALQC